METLLLLALMLTVTITRAIIEGPPSIAVGSPPPEYFTFGQEFDLPCVATGNPKPVRIWLHNGQLMDADKANIKVTTDGIIVTGEHLADEGRYQCLATNQYGAALSQLFTVKFALQEPPSIAVGSPPPEYFTFGQEFDLPCVATGTPKPERMWVHNGNQMNLNMANIKQTTDGITVTGEGSAYQGQYQCMAKNLYGLALSQLFTVTFALIGDFDGSSDIQPYISTVGHYIKVQRANIDSIPKPRYDWKTVVSTDDMNPTYLTRSRRIIQDLEGNLYFTYLKKDDEMQRKRIYKVDIFNTITNSTKGGSYSQIRVEGNPDCPAANSPRLVYPLTTKPQEVFLEGKEMKIQCIFSGNPDVDVSWVGPVMGELTEANTILTIEKMSKEAEGEYTCTGINKHGSQSKSIKVDMQTLPKFTEDEKPQPQTLSEGDSATFICQTTPDTDPPADINFMIDGQYVDESDPGVTTKIISIRNGKKMTIAEVEQATDTKVIQCVASNVNGVVYLNAALNVLGEDHEDGTKRKCFGGRRCPTKRQTGWDAVGVDHEESTMRKRCVGRCNRTKQLNHRGGQHVRWSSTRGAPTEASCGKNSLDKRPCNKSNFHFKKVLQGIQIPPMI